MWCDKFDMDIKKAVPDFAQALGETKDWTLYTVGGVTDGKLNHPATWNQYIGSIAFFAFDNIASAIPQGYYCGDSQPVQCTFEEAIRDCWPHNYVIILRYFTVEGWQSGLIWDSFCPEIRNVFDTLMAHNRGWKEVHEQVVKGLQADVYLSLEIAARRLMRARELVILGANNEPATTASPDEKMAGRREAKS